ncbi:hypothetical protein H0E87_031625, partial [Populus deltoides]
VVHPNEIMDCQNQTTVTSVKCLVRVLVFGKRSLFNEAPPLFWIKQVTPLFNKSKDNT